jgi:hypothetical protein
MPIYFIIYSVMPYSSDIQYQVKQVHRVIKCQLEDVQDMYKQNADMFNNSHYPYCQVDIVFRPDNSHLEEISRGI